MKHFLIRDVCPLNFRRSLEELFYRGLLPLFDFFFGLPLCSLDLSFFKPTRGNVLRLRLLGGKLGHFPDTSETFAVSLTMLQESTIIVVERPFVVVPCPIEDCFVVFPSRFKCSGSCSCSDSCRCRSIRGGGSSSGGIVVGSVRVWFGHRGGRVVGGVVVRRRSLLQKCWKRDAGFGCMCFSQIELERRPTCTHRICTQGSNIDLKMKDTCVVGMYCI